MPGARGRSPEEAVLTSLLVDTAFGSKNLKMPVSCGEKFLDLGVLARTLKFLRIDLRERLIGLLLAAGGRLFVGLDSSVKYRHEGVPFSLLPGQAIGQIKPETLASPHQRVAGLLKFPPF